MIIITIGIVILSLLFCVFLKIVVNNHSLPIKYITSRNVIMLLRSMVSKKMHCFDLRGKNNQLHILKHRGFITRKHHELNPFSGVLCMHARLQKGICELNKVSCACSVQNAYKSLALILLLSGFRSVSFLIVKPLLGLRCCLATLNMAKIV